MSDTTTTSPESLPNNFTSRAALIDHLRALNPHLADETVGETLQGGRAAAQDRLAAVDAIAYGRSRNFLDEDGGVHADLT
ncbi:MAG: hypothetical protein EBT71_05990, partial [Alphaproteobacteria bacterium]|nr:hypothetical protein [Alphaproteobacteria bacterium]